MMIAKNKSKLVVLLIVTSMLLQLFGSVAMFAAPVSQLKIDNSTTAHSLDAMAELMVSTTYSEYLALHDEIPDATVTLDKVMAADYYIPEVVDEETAEKVKGYANVALVKDETTGEDVLYTPGHGKVSFKVAVPETAMYTIKIKYRPLVGSWDEARTDDDSHGSNIERILLIDDLVPYKEARTLNFSRFWADDYILNKGYESVLGEDGRYNFRLDFNKNEMRPTKSEAPEWVETYITDSETFFDAPLKFMLEEGEHVITFEAACEPMAIAWLEVGFAEEILTYDEYLAKYADAESASANAEAIMIHAETPYQTSEQVIYAMNDRTSGITYPQDPAASLLNTIGGNGGDKWKNPGQWIMYEVEVAEDGWYDIIPRFKQTINQGLFSSRSLKIDGEYPFLEAKSLQFKYGENWQTKKFNDGNQEFKFYLTKGRHTIELKAVLGGMADVLGEIESIQTNLNDYYRQILMITGSEPDQYTDYEFSKLIPGVITGMKLEKKNLDAVSKALEEKIGTKGENTVILDRISFLLDEMSRDENKIATNLGNLKSYIGSLGTWLLSTKSQPLQLDYIIVQPEGKEVPKANANFFESMMHEFKSFVMSFFTDYNSIGSSTKIGDNDENAVEVWITTGRDQATIMRQMVDDSFNNENVAVNLKLIAGGTLLPATLAGVGPDVSMDGDPNGYGIRNAVIPLNYFQDETVAQINDRVTLPGGQKIYTYDEVKKNYFRDNDELFVPLTILDPDRVEYVDEKDESKGYKVIDGIERNGIVSYGLPYTIDFPMLFYRKDIFVELGLDVPETWDEVEAVIRALSENQMEMGFSQAMTQIYMYQNGIEWFESAENYLDYYENPEEITRNSKEYLRTVGIGSNLDSNGALDAFQRMTEWFTLYGEPVSFDFANRFRTGEMPIAIAAYTTYNQLKVFAPEIAGLWEFVQLPGVERVDEAGNKYIDHSTPGTPAAVMMMKDAADDIKPGQDITESKKAQNAWAYLQWWVSKDTQERFGKEQVALMGTAAKYNTANVDALLGQSWTAQEKTNLEQQFASLKGTPMSPGNYIVARYTNFAFYDVVNKDEVPAEALRGYVDDIDHELSRKRAEYGFITREEYFEELGIER